MEKRESINKYARYQVDGGIFYAVYNPGSIIDLEAAQFLVQERYKLCNGKSYPILVDLRNLKHATSEATKYFSTEEGSAFIIAGAFLIDSFLSKMIGNFYLKN